MTSGRRRRATKFGRQTAAALAVLLGIGLSVAPSALPAGAAVPKLPKSGVETPNAGTVSETGSSLLYPLWNKWVPGYETQFHHDVTIQTSSTGSGTGITDATDGTADIGASDAYLSPSEMHATPTLLDIPLAISSQLVVYNLPGVSGTLKFSGPLLAKIYEGKVTTWDAPQITAINHGVHLPKMPIVTLHRSDSSGDTFLFTQYLSKSDPSGWGATIHFTTTISWPPAPGALGEVGNSGMLSACTTTPGCIAYIGISYETGILMGKLHFGALENAQGTFVLPTTTSIRAEVNSFTAKTPKSGAVSLIFGPAKGGYPIVNDEYAIVKSHQPSAAVAERIRSVLEWVVDPADGNSPGYLSTVYFQPLPASIRTRTLKAILSIT